MIERQRSSTTVDIRCTDCGKPMVMLKFNYTSLERGFESISLRCQYCKAEETRPWPKAEVGEARPDRQAQHAGEAADNEDHQLELDAPRTSDSSSSTESDPQDQECT